MSVCVCVSGRDAVLNLKYTFLARLLTPPLVLPRVPAVSVSHPRVLLAVPPWQAVCQRSQEAVQALPNELII